MGATTTALVGGVLAVGSVVGLGVAYVALQHRDHPAATPMGKWAGLAALGGLCYAGVVVVPTARALLAVGNAFLVLTIGYYLLFTLAYTGRDAWLTPRRRGAILAVFGVATVLSLLDTLVLRRMVVETHAGLTYPVLHDGGVTLLALTLLAFATLFVGFGLLVGFLLAPGNMYRKQTAIITAAIGLSILVSIFFQVGLNPHPGLNLTSVFYVVEAALIALALFRYEFLNVEPLAPEIVLERMDDPVFVLDEQSRIVDTNPAARRLVSVSNPVGTSVEELVPGLLEAAETDEEFVPPTRTDGKGGSGAGGTVEVYDCNAAPISDQYDRDRGEVVVLRDISVQKQRERTLERLQDVTRQFLAAETAEEVCEIAVTAADELLEYPYSGAMLYDEAANELKPAAFADALAATYADAGVIDDPDVMNLGPGETDIWQVFETGEPMRGEPIEAAGFPVEIGGSLLYPLGEYGVLGISAGPDHEGFSDDDRQFAEILASTTENALERVAKERELRESRELLATRNEQIGFFNSVLRHDLLNGMQILRMHVDELEDRVDEDLRPHVDVIDEYSQDMVDLTRNVRAVTSAIDEEASPLEPVDLGALLEAAVSKLRASHADVAVTVGVDPGDLPAVQADEFLAAVFENLLGNSVEHNDQEQVEIEIDAVLSPETVTVTIADNGPGIDDAAKEAVFEQSVTADDSGSIGFGLYFVRVMVDRYGGEVWFEDRDEERGTIAVVELPRADPE